MPNSEARTTSFLVGISVVGLLAAFSIVDSPPVAVVPQHTPGAIASTDKADICGFSEGLSYSKRHRHTPPELKREIRQRDGCVPPSEVDHMVPLALGGADTRENLWCQPGTGTWNYHKKDRLEVTLWEDVCHRHNVSLEDAQAAFTGPDWRIPYCHLFGAEDRDCATLSSSKKSQ